MGEINNVLNVYMSDPKRIQSVLEYYIKEKLPDSWANDCHDADGFYSVRSSKGRISFRQRDILKRITSKQDAESGLDRAVPKGYYLGIENQAGINLIFPWRLMQMDCLLYENQIERIQQKNIEQKAVYRVEDDYKYRYKSGDSIIPVVNLVLYWGKRKWHKPFGIKDMSDMSGVTKGIGRMFEDYRIHLVDMRAIPETALEQMDSDLKYVLGLMKCSGSKKKCKEYISQHAEYFRNVPKSAVDVLEVCMNLGGLAKYISCKSTKGNDEEVADMCKAIDDMERSAVERGRRDSRQQDIRNMMKNLKMTAKQAMTVLEIPEKEQARYLRKL